MLETAKKFEIPLKKRQDIALFIHIRRLSKLMSINYLSRESGVHIYELHRILKAERNKINPFHLIEIARVLEINYLWFYQIIGYIDNKKISKETKKIIKKFKNLNDDDMDNLHLIPDYLMPIEEQEEILETLEEFEEDGYPDDLLDTLGYPEELGETYKKEQKNKKRAEKIAKAEKEIENEKEKNKK